ncbi:hypothetical protein JW988_02305 [Candidatus Bathyarchaeota archaeon]|nr:hypothetical protein [Candidatus Bathyarchaeota archaeon]
MHLSNTRKALSPVMSGGILICIAIAVALATVAWMNGLPNPDMQTENLQVTSHQLGPKLSYVDISLHNNGTQSAKINSITVNSQPTTVVYIAGSNQINTGETAILRVANTFTPNETYQIALQTVKGSKIVYTVTA